MTGGRLMTLISSSMEDSEMTLEMTFGPKQVWETEDTCQLPFTLTYAIIYVSEQLSVRSDWY